MGAAGRNVLIAGAGPVGLAAAVELVRRGFKPRIVDDAEGPVPLAESRALGVNARSLTLLSPSGVTDLILEKAQPIRHFRIKDGGKTLISLDTGQISGRFGAICGLPQGMTERLLVKRLADYGLSPEWNVKLETVSGDLLRPQVTLRHQDNAAEVVVPDILIAADGAHSAARQAVGFGFPGESLESNFYLADFRYVSPVETDFAEIVLFDPGMVGRLPVAPDTLRFISTLSDFESRIVHPAAVADRVWSSQFRIHFRHVERMSKGNVFLAGDAAHIHSPAGARGMNLGIEDACWLAYLIAEGREQEYSDRRMPAVKTVLKQTYGLTSLVTMENPMAIGLRNLVVPILLRVPPIARRLLRAVAGYDTPLPVWIDGAE